MSRDWTPEQQYLITKETDKDFGFLNVRWRFADGTEKEMYSQEEKDILRSYKVLGRAGLDMTLKLHKECEKNGCLELLRKIDDLLVMYCEGNKIDLDETVMKWFRGKLVEGFYYREENNQLFEEYVMRHIEEMKREDELLVYNGEIVDLSDGDRCLAIMVADGKMYISDSDHQDCFEQYCQDIGVDSGLDWSDPNNYDEVQEEAIKITNSLFEDEDKEIYGFDVFYEGDELYLTSHFPHNMEKCYEMMRDYAKENDYVMATFFNEDFRDYHVKVIDVNRSNERYESQEVKGDKKDYYVRGLDEQDRDQVEAMDEMSGNCLGQWLDCEEYGWGLFLDEELIGYCSVGGADDCAGMISDHALYDTEAYILSDVYVKRDCRGRGLGTMMVNSVLEKFDDMPVFLTVLYDQLEDFYKHCGFEWCDDSKSYAMVKPGRERKKDRLAEVVREAEKKKGQNPQEHSHKKEEKTAGER